MLTILFLAIAVAGHTQSDSLPAYLHTAAQNNPGVMAAFHAYEAALQKVPQAAALQNPTLDAGFFLKPMELVEGRQIADFRLMQMFPWFGTRKAARTEAQNAAQMAFEEFRNSRDQLFLDVYTQWFTLCRLQQQVANSRANRSLLAQLETLALQNPGTASGNSPQPNMRTAPDNSTPASGSSMQGMSMGNGQQPTTTATATSTEMPNNSMGTMSGNTSSGMADVLRIQMEIAETDANTEILLSEIATEKARFNALLNRSADSPVELPDTLLQIPFQLDLNATRALIDAQNPMLAMLDAQEQMYIAQADMQRKMSYPMFGIGIDYMLIAPLEANGSMGSSMSMNGRDMLMPMLSITLPIWRGKYRAQQRETALLQQSAREKRQNEQNLLEAELRRASYQLDATARRTALYRHQSELAKTTYNITVSEFSTGKNTLANVIQASRQLLDYELKIAEATANYNTTVAAIQKLIAGFNND
ncbi:MAG: TolC family protein [Bacteroidales bacterium]|nr:TolC family protein [Bacteroidales bacterium]